MLISAIEHLCVSDIYQSPRTLIRAGNRYADPPGTPSSTITWLLVSGGHLNVPDTLLLTVDEVADHLRISTRTVRRLIQAGEIPTVPIGRSLRIRRYDLNVYVDGRVSRKHNSDCAGPGVLIKEKQACHTDAKTVPSGGRLLPGQTAKELDALLGQATRRKRKPSRPSGSSKRTANDNGKNSRRDRSTN